MKEGERNGKKKKQVITCTGTIPYDEFYHYTYLKCTNGENSNKENSKEK